MNTSTNDNNSIRPFVPAILWALFIFGLSAKPTLNLPEELGDLLAPDKWAHAFVYGVLTLLIIRGYFKNSNWTRRTTVIAIILSTTLGILMEIMQYAFFPNRYFEFLDIIANISGTIGSLFFTRFFIK